jgi:6-phosphogluconolactonase
MARPRAERSRKSQWDPVIEFVKNHAELAEVGAKIFVERAQVALLERPRFSVVLSGGETPRLLYETLVTEEFRGQVNWEKIDFFFGDERNVLPDSSRSNFKMAWEAMLSRVPVPRDHIHRFVTESGNPDQVAREYEIVIRNYFDAKPIPERPLFDLVFLGLGPDGHVASLFADIREPPDRLSFAAWVPHLNEFRLSLTSEALNLSRTAMILVSGAEKASALRNAIEGEPSGSFSAARKIMPVGGPLVWLVDESAAASLSTRQPGVSDRFNSIHSLHPVKEGSS